MSQLNKKFPGRLAIQQRVLPRYRAPFFDTLAASCEGGMSLFAGEPRPEESIATTTTLRITQYAMAKNFHILRGSLYICYQQNLIQWLEETNPDALILEANPRYLATPAAIKWMRARNRPVIGWGLGAPQQTRVLARFRQKNWIRFLNKFDALIAYSERGAANYAALGIPEERIFVAHNAVAHKPSGGLVTRPIRQSYERLIALFVGRLQERKKIDNLLRVCAALPKELQPNLWIVGDGPVRESLEALAQDIYPNARFFGEKHGAELKMIWAEADKLGYFINTVTEPVLAKEKQVVKNEKRQSNDNRPYGHTQYVIDKNLYPEGHPYSWQVIGSLEDLQNATLQDVKDFFNRWYVPNNVTLVISGDFDEDQAKQWIHKYFDEIPKGQPIVANNKQAAVLKESKHIFSREPYFFGFILLSCLSYPMLTYLSKLVPIWFSEQDITGDWFAGFNISFGLGSLFTGLIVTKVLNRLPHAHIIFASMTILSLTLIGMSFSLHPMGILMLIALFGVFNALNRIARINWMHHTVSIHQRGRVDGGISMFSTTVQSLSYVVIAMLSHYDMTRYGFIFAAVGMMGAVGAMWALHKNIGNNNELALQTVMK